MSLNVELRYGTPKHGKVLGALNARKDLWERKFTDKLERLSDDDDIYTAYIKETDENKIRKQNRDDGEPEYTTLIVPYSYASLLSAHTYWTSVFLSRSPIHQFTGRHGEAQHKVQAVEALIDYQVATALLAAKYYIWMHDAPRYGYGVICTYWAEDKQRISTIENVPQTFMGMELPGAPTKRVKLTKEIVAYAGNKVMNVHPSDAMFDPRVPLVDFQKGEFAGRKVRLSWNELVRGRAAGRYFNVDAAKEVSNRSREAREQYFGMKIVLPSEEDTSLSGEIGDVGVFDAYELFVDLIPKDWELGSATLPEKWVFTVTTDSVVIEARPMGNFHGQFPLQVLPNEVDGYSISNRSMLEVLEPMNDALTWLLNSHMFNVRATLNNQFIYDPSRVVTKDLTRKGAGKLIRLKETAYGSDVRAVISQLQTADVTQGHLRDMGIITDMMNRVSGVTDNLMAVLNQGGRKTATEVRQSNTAGLTRLKTQAEYWSAVAMAPHAQILLQNTQQFYDDQQMFRIAGDLMEEAGQLTVGPDDIMGFYDFVPVDGTLPVDRFAQANLWKEILFGLAKMPELGMQFDIPGIFTWMAQMAGLKNIKRFKVQAMPNQQALGMAQAGNIIPLGGQGGAGGQPPGQQRAAGPGGTPRDMGRLPIPSQIPGMGPAA